jgi:serine/threonine protein kinase
MAALNSSNDRRCARRRMRRSLCAADVALERTHKNRLGRKIFSSFFVSALLQVAQEKQMNSVLREIDIMKGVDSPHIVKYFANYFWKKEIWVRLRSSSVGIG